MNTVEPIRDRKKLTEILEGLERDNTCHGKRLYLLFATMYYTGLRVSDVVKLQKKHVAGGYIVTIEQKTGKRQRIAIPKDLRDIYDVRVSDYEDNDYLFPSRNHRPDGTDRHITTRQAGYDMEIIKKRFAINFPFACHSLRKTHGYMRYKYSGDSLEVLRLHFNHADEATTRRYIGIDEEERNKNLEMLRAGDYRPPVPPRRTKRKGKEGAELEIIRQDRETNGILWGEMKKESARRKAEKERQKKIKEAERKAAKKAYDADRYERKIKPERIRQRNTGDTEAEKE